MHEHVKPTVTDFNPDHVILPCGTNDLSSERTASRIARSTIDLALPLKLQNNKILIPLITPTNDDSLNNKASELSIVV